MNNHGIIGILKPTGKNFTNKFKKAPLFFILGIVLIASMTVALWAAKHFFVKGSLILDIIFYSGLASPAILIMQDADRKEYIDSIFFGFGCTIGVYIVLRFFSANVFTPLSAATKTLEIFITYFIVGTFIYCIRRFVK